MIDNFEQCRRLESWLREDFLPQLPEDVLVVIAGRNPPSPAWRTDPSWAGALRVETLRDLAPADAAALLLARGVAPELHESLLGFAGGHPLALTLAAEVAARAGARLTVHAPSRDVIEAMLAQLVGTVPSPEHRLALQVCAHGLQHHRGPAAHGAAGRRPPRRCSAGCAGCRSSSRAPTGSSRTTWCATRWRWTCTGGTR